MSKSFTTQMVGCKFSHQIWKRLEEYFASQTKAKVRQLKSQLRSTKKIGSLNAYLLEIKKIMDNLASIGALVNEEDHVDAILDGLLEDYFALVTVITSKTEPCFVSQVEALLMAHEERLEKC